MPKPRKYELIPCIHFTWRLSRRGDVFYADGRSNQQSAGRHSLGTSDKAEARRLLVELDDRRAVDLGMIPRPIAQRRDEKPLSIKEGRKLYEEHVSRTIVTGGVRASTQKRYRAVFDKFEQFTKSIGITSWNIVDKNVLSCYAAHLERTGFLTPHGKKKQYKHKTLHTELTTLKQCIGWLIEEGYLSIAKINLPLKKAESERPYCWTVTEVAAMVEHCQQPKLRWLGNVIIALACTGLRISELASLKWSDVDLEKQQLQLTDETAYGKRGDEECRQTKSGRSRSFPIHPDFLEVLGSLPHNGRYIFHGPRGGRLKPDSVRNALVEKVLKPLASRFPTPDGVKGFSHGRLHSYRHYFCSRCANEGVPERMVMEWLGHADSAMVRHYYHLHDEEAQRQMKRLDLLGNAGKRFAGNINGTADLKMEDSPGRESLRKS